jgi:hypothetical protein
MGATQVTAAIAPLRTGLFAALLCSALLFAGARAEDVNPSVTQAQLLATVTALDAQLFGAYNSCDLGKLGALVAADLEFYHDKTGLSRGREPFLAAIKDNICGKVHRELVPGTLEVYPLAHYGAVEIGAHVFCDPRQVTHCDPAKSGIAKFVMLWQHTGEGWQLTRVISYDHQSDRQRANTARHEQQ